MLLRKVISLVLFFVVVSCGKKTARFELLEVSSTGINFNNEIIEKDSFNIMHNEYMYNGGGVGIADLNNDGLPDIIFVGNKVSTKIFQNSGEMKFLDITKNFEGLTNEEWLSGVSVTDINADGWIDLYFSASMSKDSLKRKNQLWVNQGLSEVNKQPHFKEMADAYGIADMGYSMHSAFFDYDLDGDMDLYVLNNIVTKEVPTNYRPKIIDGSSVNNDKLYRNNGDGHFTDVTKEAGIVYEGFGLGIAVGDVNKDGYPDIYTSNDYISNDLLYINQKDGTFKNEAKEFISYQSRFSMGNDMTDINNDGNLDIITMDMMPEQYFRKKQTINGNSYFVYMNNEKYNYEPQFSRNMVHLHNGFLNNKMLPFSEVGQLMGVYQTEWSWSPLFADFDNDGDRDLFITNGFPKDLTDKDFTNYKAQVYGSLATDQDIIPRIPIVKVPNYAYENKGDYHFEDQTESWGMKIPSFSNGAAFVDLDNDGDLDYVVNNINDPAFIYRNNTIGRLKEKPNYVRLSLKGKDNNTLAIGAKVELWSNDTYQYYEHFLSRGYLSSIDPIIHFGLGANMKIDSIRVIWPNGKNETILKTVVPNQVIIIVESESKPVREPFKYIRKENLLFEKEVGLIEYTHLQQDYVDFFQNQRILQHKLSQIGPCMAKGDIDGDHIDDIVIGASLQSPTTVFLHKGDQFIKSEIKGLSGNKQCTESDLVVVDVDGDGDNDLIALSGGYANENESDYLHYLYTNNDGVFTRGILPLPAFVASIVRPFDYDHDGDVDLFVGGRVKRGNYPFSSMSYLLINDHGKFAENQMVSFNLGMVTDAVWSDYNSDGWEDILITREWNTIAILENNKGQKLTTLNQQHSGDKYGFWYSIAAGDFDHDGDDDYVVGNLGENNRFTVNNSFPMSVYATDVDKNGSIDPVTTAYWKDENGVMQEYPVNYLDELTAQSPFFRREFASYTKFSFTIMDSIVNKALLPDSSKFHVNTTSSYIVWNDKGKFEWERLPSATQVAPIKKMIVKDFNGDSILDLLVAGNDNSFDVSTGYYDANKGIVLLGKGNRKFEISSSSKSGLLLQGQVESLLYIEGNTPLLIAGINRSGIFVFKNIAKK